MVSTLLQHLKTFATRAGNHLAGEARALRGRLRRLPRLEARAQVKNTGILRLFLWHLGAVVLLLVFMVLCVVLASTPLMAAHPGLSALGLALGALLVAYVHYRLYRLSGNIRQAQIRLLQRLYCFFIISTMLAALFSVAASLLYALWHVFAAGGGK